MPPITPSAQRFLPPKPGGASTQSPLHLPSSSQPPNRFQTPAHFHHLSYNASDANARPPPPPPPLSQFQTSSTRSGGMQLPFLLSRNAPQRTRHRDLVDDVVVSSSPPDEYIPESDIGQDSDDDNDARPRNRMADDVDEDSQDIQLPAFKKRRVSISFSSDAGDIHAAAGDDVTDDHDQDHMPSSLPRIRQHRTTSYQAGSSPPPLPDLGCTSMLDRYMYTATAVPSSQASHNHITTIEQFQQPTVEQFQQPTIQQFQQPTIQQFQQPSAHQLQQPTFQRAPRFREATQSTDAEVMPLLFSPQKKAKNKPKYTPGGLAASMQGWLAHVRGLAGIEETVRVVRVRREQRMAMALVVRDECIDGQPVGEETARMVLAGDGAARDTERGVVVPGCTVAVSPPTWWVRLEGEEWLVACDWRVIEDASDRQDAPSDRPGAVSEKGGEA